jgi:hypothetical protein
MCQDTPSAWIPMKFGASAVLFELIKFSKFHVDR